MAPKDTDNFVKTFQDKKKHLEMEIIKHNLSQELYEDLFELARPNIREIKSKVRNRRLR